MEAIGAIASFVTVGGLISKAVKLPRDWKAAPDTLEKYEIMLVAIIASGTFVTNVLDHSPSLTSVMQGEAEILSQVATAIESCRKEIPVVVANAKVLLCAVKKVNISKQEDEDQAGPSVARCRRRTSAYWRLKRIRDDVNMLLLVSDQMKATMELALSAYEARENSVAHEKTLASVKESRLAAHVDAQGTQRLVKSLLSEWNHSRGLHCGPQAYPSHRSYVFGQTSSFHRSSIDRSSGVKSVGDNLLIPSAAEKSQQQAISPEFGRLDSAGANNVSSEISHHSEPEIQDGDSERPSPNSRALLSNYGPEGSVDDLPCTNGMLATKGAEQPLPSNSQPSQTQHGVEPDTGDRSPLDLQVTNYDEICPIATENDAAKAQAASYDPSISQPCPFCRGIVEISLLEWPTIFRTDPIGRTHLCWRDPPPADSGFDPIFWVLKASYNVLKFTSGMNFF